MAGDTRERIRQAAMRLFGEQGFAATSVAQIEAAAGLSPGSGGLYKHFASKDEVLSAGIRERIEDRGELLGSMAVISAGVSAEQVLSGIARLGLKRLDDERDVNRMLVRDLASRPELLAFFRDAELRTNHAALVGVLRALWPENAAIDHEAIATILIDAVAHYWLMADIYGGEHPTGISPERYVTALASLAAQAGAAS